ncbi:hypothetical protein [Enterococcus sp. LJL90]
MFDNLAAMSMELWDVDSQIKIEIEADHLNIKSGKEEMVLWLQDSQIYPAFSHDFDTNNAMEIERMISILQIIQKYSDE